MVHEVSEVQRSIPEAVLVLNVTVKPLDLPVAVRVPSFAPVRVTVVGLVPVLLTEVFVPAVQLSNS